MADIVTAFKHSLPDIKWMDGESADAAAHKADNIRVKVGFPLSPDTRDPWSIASYYARVRIDEDTFFENMLSARVADEVRRWLSLGMQRDPEKWEMYPSMVNAYFNPPSNEVCFLCRVSANYSDADLMQIVFPAGILQPPFFSQDW